MGKKDKQKLPIILNVVKEDTVNLAEGERARNLPSKQIAFKIRPKGVGYVK